MSDKKSMETSDEIDQQPIYLLSWRMTLIHISSPRVLSTIPLASGYSKRDSLDLERWEKQIRFLDRKTSAI